MVELLKQGQYEPVPVEKQIVSIWSGTSGYLDDVQVEDVRRFEAELLVRRGQPPWVLEHIREQGTLPEEVEQQLKDAVTEFRRRFRPSEGAPPLREAGPRRWKRKISSRRASSATSAPAGRGSRPPCQRSCGSSAAGSGRCSRP